MHVANTSVGNVPVKTEIVSYGTTSRFFDEVCMTPGASFGLNELRKELFRDPTAMDTGSILVQTVDQSNKRHKIYLDVEHAVDPARPWLVADLSQFENAYPGNVITIGQQWESPFGLTGPVTGVALPYTSGLTENMINHYKPGREHSVTFAGRIALLKAIGQPTDAYEL